MYASGNIGSNLAAAEMNARREGVQVKISFHLVVDKIWWASGSFFYSLP